MFGIFKKFKKGLNKTSRSVADGIGGIFGRKRLDEETIALFEETLFASDFGVETTEEIISEIKGAYKKDKELRGLDAAKIGASVLMKTLSGAEGVWKSQHPLEVIALIGVNGSGKTTTAAKLAYLFRQDGLNPLLGACDTFRAAANEQIKEWAERLDLGLISSHHGADAAAVAFDAYDAAKNRGHDLLILDTAGRLHTKENLMEELKKVRRVLQKQDESAPHHAWIVIDGSLGSNSIEQAKVFHEHFGLTGVIVTKLDGTSRGGALAGIYRELKLPIYFVGLGEQPEDLQPFSVENYAKAVFDIEEEVSIHAN